MTSEIAAALSALESLSSSPSTSASGPLTVLLEEHFARARQRIQDGEEPSAVVSDLQKQVVRAKKEVEKGLKGWYAGLGGVGKAVEKNFPPNLATISSAYSEPPLFSTPAAQVALDRVVLDSLGRRGLWDAVDALEEEAGCSYDKEKRRLAKEMHAIIDDIESGDVSSALAWCDFNAAYLSAPPHPSPLPYHLHRHVFLSLPTAAEALAYARQNLMIYVPTQPVLQLLTSRLYADRASTAGTPPSPYSAELARQALSTQPLVSMFRAEFCRRHGWPKEEPLEVVVDLGSRGGALNVIEKARRVMGEHLGNVRTWQELPMEVPLPSSRRYHSIFVCPVSKEQATDVNPPKMLLCGHVIAEESFARMLKSSRRPVKCPYCPAETSQSAAQRLYF